MFNDLFCLIIFRISVFCYCKDLADFALKGCNFDFRLFFVSLV